MYVPDYLDGALTGPAIEIVLRLSVLILLPSFQTYFGQRLLAFQLETHSDKASAAEGYE